MKKFFLMILALMFTVGIFGNASAQSSLNILENNQMIFLDYDIIDEADDDDDEVWGKIEKEVQVKYVVPSTIDLVNKM